MPEAVISTYVYWPAGIALGCWLFVEIGKRM
ncbi:hypothetical protein DFR50_13724 [Roseiarcus fermentans]|uniref:Uncharacterized protein n=1 Tax=Roseiarcus fermentans TaxID=1473586 RepID=A0A366EU61_9HYPH|nr:hypothetical protein DFR50_13724 [Roseiarcus fermentans]